MTLTNDFANETTNGNGHSRSIGVLHTLMHYTINNNKFTRVAKFSFPLLVRVRVTSIKIPNESPNPPVSSHSLVRIQRPSVHASVISDEFTCRDI